MAAGSALERVVRRATMPTSDVERCDLCACPLTDRHRHLLDRQRDDVVCTCQACSILFDRSGADTGHYRLIPQRRQRLSGVSARELGVPVGLAYFVPRTDGTVVAAYPSPAGATRWDVDPAAWQRACTHCPALTGLEPEVEALLVNAVSGADEQWLVPIDDCLRLVALVRSEWRGLSGGSSVWPAVSRFFAELRESRG